MNRFLRLLPLLALLASTAGFAGEDDAFAAVRQADERRIAATLAGDAGRLADFLSAELHYAHSDGRVQNKEQFLAAVSGNKVRYLSFVPHDVKFQSIASGAVAMNGRARLAAEAGGRRVEFTLRFLAVWREESGQWRLLSYQSSQLAETPAGP